MADNLSDLLDRSTVCTDPCGNATGDVTDPDECFAYSQESDYIQAVEPDCPTWKNGWKCRTESFVGNITWLFNKLTCAIKNLNERVTALEDENPVIGWESQDTDADGVYEIIVTYRDGTTGTYEIEDTDTRLTNPRPQDLDNNGIYDQVLWDVIDDEGNVIGSEVVPVQEYVTTTNQNTRLTFNSNTGLLRLFQTVGGALSVTIPPSSGSGITLVNNGNPVQLWSTGEIGVNSLPDNFNTNVSAHVPTTANGVIVRVYLEVDSTAAAAPVEISMTVNSKLAGGAESGGTVPISDNSFWADMMFPRSGNTVKARITLNYGANPAVYQTKGYLIGYF